MRKIFSLLMATLLSVVLWAQAPAGTTLFSENFGGYAKDAVLSGSVSSAQGSRVIYGGGSVTYTSADNGTNKTKIYTEALAGGTSPELLVGKSGGVFTIAGIPSGNAQEITVSFKQNAQKLTVSLAGTGYSTEYASPKPSAAGEVSFDVTVADGADATFSLIMTAASSNVRVDDILVTVKTAGEGGGEEETSRTIYLNGGGSALWNQADAEFFAHTWGGAEAVAVKMTLVEGDVYSAAIPADNANVVFVRMAPESSAIDWDNFWNKTEDLTIEGENNLYTITAWGEGEGNKVCAGAWSVYGEEPEPDYYLVGSMNDWQADEAYKFAPAETAGEFILHATLAEGDKIKVIKVEDETTTWYPAGSDNDYTVDAAHAGERDIYFRPAGNADWSEFGGYIWMGKNPEGAVYVKKALADIEATDVVIITMDNGEVYAMSNDKGTSAAPAAVAVTVSDDEIITEATNILWNIVKDGDNFSILPNGDAEKWLYCTTSNNGVRVGTNDNKLFSIDAESGYLFNNATSRYIGVYNSADWRCYTSVNSNIQNQTLAFYVKEDGEGGGDQPEEVVLPVVGLGANFNNWNYGANLLTPAEDSLSASIKVTLGVTDTLKFKIVSDNNWLSLNGEGEDGLYGLHRGWPTAEHINLVNNGRNFALNADVAGEYTFTWFYADSTLTITFPDKPENQLPVVGFGANCNVWNYGENLFVPAEDSLSASYKVTLGVTDTIQFKIVSDNNWLSLNGEGEDGLYGLHRGWPTAEHINLVNNGRNFALNADVAGEYTFTWTYADSTLTVTFPELPKFYVAGSMTDWDTNKIPVYDNSYTLENLAAGKYQLKVVDGAQWLGIDSMTTVAGNLYKDQDGNVCFILAEAGNVVVNYVSGESFTLAGSFATPVVQLIGIAGWESGNEIALTPAEDNLSASVKLNLTGEWYDFKVIRAGDWLGKENEGTDNYRIWSGCKWVDGLIRDYDGLKSVSLQPAAEGDYIFTYEYATGKLTVTFPETRLADGYYLIGLTMADWTVEYITADYLFVENAENPGEYMLDVTLAAEQQFKVVKVESDAIVTWYPDGENNNFVVDANHAGNKTVYFRPNGDGGEGWHYNVIYVAANDATAIDETVAAGKAAKVLRDGQILIIKGEKIFNVQGQRVK